MPTIDVISDVVCPWCFIGKRKLERALLMESESWVVRWHPFQLNPDLPPSGIARSDYLRRKFGSADGGKIYERVRAAGRTVGIEFAFEAIERQPNTLAAHALIAAAGAHDAEEAMVERLFRAYFLEGEDLTNEENLVRIAAKAGLMKEAAEAALHDEALRARVAAADMEARRMGVSGVPFFIFDGVVSVAGAQDPEVLQEAMRNARAKANEEAKS